MKNIYKKSILLVIAVVMCFSMLIGVSTINNYAYAECTEVYLGGFPLGINMTINGMIVSGKSSVLTKEGVIIPLENVDIRQGDILYSINDIVVDSVQTVETQATLNDSLHLVVYRNGEKLEFDVSPKFDITSGKKKLGLMLQDSINGIGTISYINATTMRYGALGHPISTNENISLKKGRVFNCKILGVNKGVKGSAGSLEGYYNIKSQEIGTLDNTNPYGIFGNYCGDVSNLQKIQTADRSQAKCGKAQIYTTISGCEPKYYDIEIIRVYNQSSPKDKGLVLRVLDKELLQTSGGIVQGMSGSPIIQNGKLIGAVTHVFINDPTKGYGVFIDWMINN